LPCCLPGSGFTFRPFRASKSWRSRFQGLHPWLQYFAPSEHGRPACKASPAGAPLKPTDVPLKPTGMPLKPTSVPLKPTGVLLKPTSVLLKPTSVPLGNTSVPIGNGRTIPWNHGLPPKDGISQPIDLNWLTRTGLNLSPQPIDTQWPGVYQSRLPRPHG